MTPSPAHPDEPTVPVQTGVQLKLYSCHTCGRVSQWQAGVGGQRHGDTTMGHTAPDPAPRTAEASGAGEPDPPLRCPRCDSPLHHRKPGSLQRTWAYTWAALLLYLPANALPIMSTSTVFGSSTHTILGGIEELRAGGDWTLALIVFIASIAVPMLKIGVLLYLNYTAQRGSRWRSRERAQLFRIVETVGHWSMLDVYVVVLLVGMIRFGAFAGVQPESGLLAFGAVVVLTMLATDSFDPRLIWPEEHEPPQGP